ncbi:TcaA second domain-containing protein [Heyndrickxia acidiproducens]|uniref:TcaA second domain-containing protein n=1 Tax=Heyndrickxia acidiproducens TaxID=1121084 RepID=UPI0003716E5B|nr:hypothetical protein [Heyndrickxia acidiproducens]
MVVRHLKNKFLIATVAAVIFATVATLIILYQATKPEKVLAKFEDAVNQKDTKQMEKLIKTDNQHALINNVSLKALLNYLKTNNNSYNVVKDGIRTQIKEKNYSQTNQQISLIEDGKKWGFFPNYKLMVKTVDLKVSGQNDRDKITVSINKMNLPKKKNQTVYGPFLPGTYQALVTVKNDLGTFFQKEKKDLWGNPEVSLVIDSNQLARKNKDVQKDIISAIQLFNHDLAVYETSGFDAEKLTNATEDFKDNFTLEQAQFNLVKEYVDEMQAQYLGSVVNFDVFSITNFDSVWRAEIEALVSYNEKIKYKGQKNDKDLSYKSIRKYTLIYNPDKKKWMIDNAKDSEADGNESNLWKNKKEIKLKDAPVMKWSREKDSKSNL